MTIGGPSSDGARNTTNRSCDVTTAVTVVETHATLQFSTVSNQTYVVEGRDDRAAGFWTTVSSKVAGTGAMVTLADPVPANLPQRFYRVRQ
jgi:hypothetical protein